MNTENPPGRSKIDDHTSLKIEALRFPLIVGIVFIHMGTNYSEAIVGGSELSAIPFKYTIHLISTVILSAVVPLFFLISAFLLFTHYRSTLENYAAKLKSRIYTLLLPYLFWNLSYLLFKLLIQASPMLSSSVGGTTKRVLDYTYFDYFDALFGWTNFPISYQFWFIRDLIIMVVLAPLIWQVTKKLSWLPVLFFAIVWLVEPGRLANIHNESWLFFSLGCLIAQRDLNLKISTSHRYLLLSIYIALALAVAGFDIAGLQLSMFAKFITVLGVAAIWYGADLITARLSNLLISLSTYSFFIYAAHEPLLGMTVKAIRKLTTIQGYSSLFLLYSIVPILTIALLWLVGKMLREKTPKFFAAITGGRAKGATAKE